MKRITFFIAIFCSALICSFQLFASLQVLTIDNQAIHGRHILAINQDPRGDFWLATDSGLFRFDGINTRPITSLEVPGLIGQSFREISSTQKHIWLSSDKGLEQINIDNQTSQVLFLGPVSHVFVQDPHSIWFLSQGRLHRYHEGQLYFPLTNLNLGAISQFALLPNGHLWVYNTDNQLIKVRLASEKVITILTHLPGIKEISADKQGRVWVIDSSHTLFQLQATQLEKYQPLSSLVLTSIKHRDNGYFYAVGKHQAYLHDSVTDQTKTIPLDQINSITNSYIDTNKQLWLQDTSGVWQTQFLPLIIDKEVATISPIYPLTQLQQKDILNGESFALKDIIQYQENSWIYSNKDGVYKYQTTHEAPTKLSIARDIHKLAVNGESLILANHHSIYSLDLETLQKSTHLEFSHINAVSNYVDQQFIFTTNKHLYALNDNQARLLALLPNQITEIYDLAYNTTKNKIYIASKEGFWQVSHELNNRFTFELLLAGDTRKITTLNDTHYWLHHNDVAKFYNLSTHEVEFVNNTVLSDSPLDLLKVGNGVLAQKNNQFITLTPTTHYQDVSQLRISEVVFTHKIQQSLLFPSDTIHLPSPVSNVQLNLASFNPSGLDYFQFKYRMLPNQEWQTMSPNQASLNIMSLPSGTHVLEIENNGEPKLQRTQLTLVSHGSNLFALIDLLAIVIAVIGLTFVFLKAKRSGLHGNSLTASLLRQTKESVWIANQDFEIIEVNKVFTQTTGYQKHDILGKKTKIYTSNGRNIQLEQLIYKELKENSFWSGQIWSSRKNAEEYYLDLTITEIKQKSIFELKNKTLYIGMFNDITTRKRHEKELQLLATRDPITGLANRTLFIEHLNKAIVDSREAFPSFALLFLDLDNFHKINESLGHSQGDVLLNLVSKRINKLLDKGCILSRLGGDEFAILIPPYLYNNMSIFYLKRQAQKILSKINNFNLNEIEVTVSASIGIALFPENGVNCESLMRSADSALNYAKHHGKNNFQFYDKKLQSSSPHSLSKESALFHAIENEEFIFYYQPKFNTIKNKIVGFEALARWPQPDGTVVGPNDFIPIAEKNGTIIALTKSLLKQACMQVKTWYEQGELVGRVAVNISAGHFQQASLIEDLTHLLTIYNISGRHLELEITESAMMQDPDFAIKQMEKLKSLGFSIALDDFGTGHSSLSYLKQFPIDTLKIDRSFIVDMVENERDRNITATIIRLAKYLDIKVVAEGVETYDQSYLLHVMGCNVVQGYYFSPPVSVANLADLKIDKPLKNNKKKAG
ncbi:hypothetical protein PULV_a1951 [Pseudoalteromonas ulvae UL12]|uniref:EAL domain-containing protein n=1 Tax=Pseudoalteromonas ulvae TaxID=107327 RepID=UPI00186BA024|nr:EAL domain-containing protein [Pseudoalteromonas ulvae]MBE0365196.1 hypothetical protein [Pseudoalteromonas ulvae UL12]